METRHTEPSLSFHSEDVLPSSQIKDSVHGYMELFPYIRAFIDTPQFRRLKRLKQLGTSYEVWPGASHNRFEHCLGVSHLANKLVEHLRKHQPSLGITERDVQCVTLAGLLHDLGHGPYSHVFDSEFIPRTRPNEKWSHEEGSEMMIDYLIEDNAIEISNYDKNFIKDLVRGEPHYSEHHHPPEKSFLFQIVANKLTGIDVDKFDYIARDWLALEGAARKDAFRLIESSRVVDGQICYNHKDWITVYNMFHERWKLHKQFYNHKTAKAVQLMLVDAFRAADGYKQISSSIRDPARYTYMTDDIVQEIQRSNVPELAESRAILRRIERRELYRMVDFNCLSWDSEKLIRENITEKRLAEVAKQIISTSSELGQAFPTENDIVVSIVKIHFGYGKSNPMDQVKFYSKRNPNIARTAGASNASQLLPKQFGEILVSIFTKNNQHFGIIQAAYRKLRQMNQMVDIGDSDDAPPTPTAAATSEPPTTPRLLGKNSSLSSIEDNAFSSVPQDYTPASPSRSVKKRTRLSFSPLPEAEMGGDSPYVTPLKKRKT